MGPKMMTTKTKIYRYTSLHGLTFACIAPLKTLSKFTNLRFLARKLENSFGPAQLLSPILFQPIEIAFCLPCTIRKIPYCISCNFSAVHLDKLTINLPTYYK